ncbi:MAG TPA: hypothetical protein DD706_12950, partial [Nitrospiraceae bacterium]|nr:hypothetical protein [Nitrospiraceae bacterium]
MKTFWQARKFVDFGIWSIVGVLLVVGLLLPTAYAETKELSRGKREVAGIKLTKKRVIALVNQRLEFKLEYFFLIDNRARKSQWILDGKQISSGESLALTFDKPGRHHLSIVYGDRRVDRIIDVGVQLVELFKNSGRYDFIFVVIGKNRGKAMFFPIAPGSRVEDLVAHRQAVLDQQVQAESGYVDFADRQGQVWGCKILRNPILPVSKIPEGVYALFENGLVYLGFPEKTRNALKNVKEALNHDSDVDNPSRADPGIVFSRISDLVKGFNPQDINIKQGFVAVPGAAELGVAEKWIGSHINTMFGHFIDYTNVMGLNGYNSRASLMFTYNTLNFTFSSRFSDVGLGISRHVTNMIGFGGDKGDSISLPAMQNDGENLHLGSQGGVLGLMDGEVWSVGAYWDADNEILVLGANSPDEVGSIELAGVDKEGNVVVVVNTPEGGESDETSGEATNGEETNGETTNG